jgi:hypothetical protein
MSDNPNICEDRILSEIGMLFVEGFETTGHTTSWTLFNIASVPGVQEKIAEELDSLGLLAKPGCPPPKELELDDLKRVPYLVAATKEAMRMLPVVSIMGRCADGVGFGGWENTKALLCGWWGHTAAVLCWLCVQRPGWLVARTHTDTRCE